MLRSPMTAIDVGIPAYRRPAGLVRAVESAVRQREDGLAVRVYVVNDSPGDDLSEVARRFDVEVHDNPVNLGLVRNWNRVVALAQAPLLVVLHDDDELLPGQLRRAAEAFARQPDAVMRFTAAEITAAGGKVTRIFRPFRRRREFAGTAGALALVDARVPVKAPGVVYRRDALVAAGGFDETCGMAADVAMCLRLALRGRVLYDPEPGARYFFDTGNLTHSAMFRASDLDLLARVRDTLAAESGRMDPGLWRSRFNRMIARHGVISGLYRLKSGDAPGADACFTGARLAGGGGWGWVAGSLRLAARLPGASRLYDLARAGQRWVAGRGRG